KLFCVSQKQNHPVSADVVRFAIGVVITPGSRIDLTSFGCLELTEFRDADRLAGFQITLPCLEHFEVAVDLGAFRADDNGGGSPRASFRTKRWPDSSQRAAGNDEYEQDRSECLHFAYPQINLDLGARLPNSKRCMQGRG